MYRGRGGNYRGRGQGNGRGMYGDVWYSPHNDNTHEGDYHASGPQYQGGAANNRNNNMRPGGRHDADTVICKHNAINGRIRRSHILSDRCRFGPKCHYKHTVKRALLLSEICRNGVYCLAFYCISDSRIELFATGQGTTVKCMSLDGDIRGGVTLANQRSFTLNIRDILDKEQHYRNHRNSDKVIYSLRCINDCLFAGLRTGHISVFHIPTGTSTLIYGHTSPVTGMILVDSAVISACESGKICIWSFDSALNSFSCVNSLETNNNISCIVEVTEGVARHLWAGGNAITIIDLASLGIVHTTPITNGDFVKLMVRYGQHVIVALNSGDCLVLSLSGELVYQSSGYGPEVNSMDGIQTDKGDLLLLGNKKGILSVIKLPAFQLDGTLLCNFEGSRNPKGQGISVISSLGGGLFVVGCYDGNVHIFRYVDHPENDVR